MLFCFYANAKNDTTIQNGFIDLSNHSWLKDGAANLTGEWEFYWKQFYQPDFFKDSSSYKHSYAYVPSFWNNDIPQLKKFKPAFGYATYRVVVKCPPTVQQLALKFLTVESAYTLFVNGKQVITVGQPGTSSSATIAELKPAIVNVTPENNILDIVVQVSNYNNRVGGLWDFIKLGTREQLEDRLLNNIALEVFIAGAFFLAGIYYLILYFPFKTRYTLLFFSLLCFIIFIRSLVTGEMPIIYITNWDWHTARRLEYISLFLSVPFMSLFSYHLFPQEFNKKVLYAVVIISSLFLLLGLFGSYYHYTYVISYYEILILIMTFYGLYVYVRAAINKRKGSLLFLFGFCIFLITIINDLLYANLVIDTIPLFYAGLAIFVIILSIILSGQFHETFLELQVANTKLAAKNSALGEMNNEITEKTGN